MVEHFEIEGIDIYADLTRHQEQVGDYANMIEPIDAHTEINWIAIGDQHLEEGVIYETIEQEILNQIGEQY